MESMPNTKRKRPWGAADGQPNDLAWRDTETTKSNIASSFPSFLRYFLSFFTSFFFCFFFFFFLSSASAAVACKGGRSG